MYLLDTDTLTFAHRGHVGVAARIREVGQANVATTVVSAVEVLRGRHEYLLKASDGNQLLLAQRLLDVTQALLRELEIIGIDSAAAAEFDRLRQNKKLKKIGRGDLLIASLALAHRATLVTRNLRDFQQIPGLRVENWAD